MQGELIKTKLALLRWQQNLNNLFTIIHLFGHQDEGGLDEPMLENVRVIIGTMQKELKITERWLDDAAYGHLPSNTNMKLHTVS